LELCKTYLTIQSANANSLTLVVPEIAVTGDRRIKTKLQVLSFNFSHALKDAGSLYNALLHSRNTVAFHLNIFKTLIRLAASYLQE
jgi:hypothetical protein